MIRSLATLFVFVFALPLFATELPIAPPIGRQEYPIIESNGNAAVAIWNDADGQGGASSFSRMISADGIPTGDVVKLPFLLGNDSDIVFDGQRFILTWTDFTSEVKTVTVSADGRTAGLVHRVGSGQGPSLATSPQGTFLIWDSFGVVMGTPLQSDGSAHVVGGFALLPSLLRDQRLSAITVVDDGFHVVFTTSAEIQSLVITAAGSPRSLTTIARSAGAGVLYLAGGPENALAALQFNQIAFVYAFGAGAVPFAEYFPRWQRTALPLAVKAVDRDRYIVAFASGPHSYVMETRMSDELVTGFGETLLLARNASPSEAGVTVVNGQTIAVWVRGGQAWVSTPEAIARRRSVGR